MSHDAAQRQRCPACVWLAGVSLGVMLVGSLDYPGTPAWAEELAPVPATAEQREPSSPSADDVARVIKELASLRDYERLYWILSAAERQVPPVRAELLHQLDEHVQQLFQAEVEVRTATVLASTQPHLSRSPATPSIETTPQPAATSSHIVSRSDAKDDHASHLSTQTYGAVEQQIERVVFTGNPKDNMEQMKTLSNAILGVEDLEQRKRLHEQLQKRYMQAAHERLEVRQAILKEQVSQELTAPDMPEDLLDEQTGSIPN